MATYRNKNDDTIIRGSEFKLNISMDTIGGHDMGDVNFKCTFSTGNASVVLQKNQMFPVTGDPTTYIAPLDSTCLAYKSIDNISQSIRGSIVSLNVPILRVLYGYGQPILTPQ